MLIVKVVSLLSLLSLATAQDQPGTVSSYLLQDGWQVVDSVTRDDDGSTVQISCSQSTCCCFYGNINIFATPETRELNVNGTVAGVCDQQVEEDNLDRPSDFNFQEEFFGEDDFTFSLGNATHDGASGWSFTALSPNFDCSFILFRESSDPLPTEPAIDTTIDPLPITAVQEAYLGTWEFDSTTCEIDSPSCCCFVGETTIVSDPAGNPSFFISGGASSGCGAAAGQDEEDDFPWPLNGTVDSSSVSVTGFLEYQDDYLISLTAAVDQSILTFQDVTNPSCSMRAIQNSPTTTATTSGDGSTATTTTSTLLR